MALCGTADRSRAAIAVVYRTRYAAVVLSGMLAAMDGASVSIGFSGSFNHDLTAVGFSSLFLILLYVLTLAADAGVIGRPVAPAADGLAYVEQ